MMTDILYRLEATIERLNRAAFEDGSECHCDSSVGMQCELCCERELLRDAKKKIEHLQDLCCFATICVLHSPPAMLGSEIRKKTTELARAADESVRRMKAAQDKIVLPPEGVLYERSMERSDEIKREATEKATQAKEADDEKQPKLCKCGKPGKPRVDNGSACGIRCDGCWDNLVTDCRKRSW